MTPYGWEGNRRSGVALTMRHRLLWFIHLRAQRTMKGRWPPSPTYTLKWYGWPLPFTVCMTGQDEKKCRGGAHARWLRAKAKQQRADRRLRKAEQEDLIEGAVTHQPKDCQRAYRRSTTSTHTHTHTHTHTYTSVSNVCLKRNSLLNTSAFSTLEVLDDNRAL